MILDTFILDEWILMILMKTHLLEEQLLSLIWKSAFLKQYLPCINDFIFLADCSDDAFDGFANILFSNLSMSITSSFPFSIFISIISDSSSYSNNLSGGIFSLGKMQLHSCLKPHFPLKLLMNADIFFLSSPLSSLQDCA
jgi:hypothetical protein